MPHPALLLAQLFPDNLSVDLMRLGLALLLGGLIGSEREWRDKGAGFRTMICIAVGACLFTQLSIRLGHGGKDGNGDVGRVAAQVVTGVGFLGAGVILREKGRVLGLTTAALIWLVAALGMACGAGQENLAMCGTGITLVVLLALPLLERRIDGAREDRVYEIELVPGERDTDFLEAMRTEARLRLVSAKDMKQEGDLVLVRRLHGRPAAHDLFTRSLLADPRVCSLTY